MKSGECGDCKWFGSFRKDIKMGQCYNLPPIRNAEYSLWIRPEVNPNTFCSKFENAKSEEIENNPVKPDEFIVYGLKSSENKIFFGQDYTKIMKGDVLAGPISIKIAENLNNGWFELFNCNSFDSIKIGDVFTIQL